MVHLNLTFETAFWLLQYMPNIAMYYYLTILRLILIYHPLEGGRLSWS